MFRQVVAVMPLVLGAAALWISPPAKADTPSINRPYVARSDDGRIALRMTPFSRIGERTPGRGVATRAGSGKVLWTVDWYALPGKVIVLNDGAGVIRFGPWAGDRYGFTDLALAFYRRGREVRRYTVGQLLRDKSRILRTASHYFWLSRHRVRQLSPDQRRLTIHLIDGSVYTFDTRTGRIVSSGR
jgi:hypothetical protein